MIAVVDKALVDLHVDGELLHPLPGGGPFNTAIALAASAWTPTSPDVDGFLEGPQSAARRNTRERWPRSSSMT